MIDDGFANRDCAMLPRLAMQQRGIAMARGLALALERPIAGIDTLSAIAANARSNRSPLVIAADARRDEVYFAIGGAPASPLVLPVSEAVRRLPSGESFVLGTGAEALIAAAPSGRLIRLKDGDLPDARNFAGLCSRVTPSDMPPEPLYLRPPDAKPQAQGSPLRGKPRSRRRARAIR